MNPEEILRKKFEEELDKAKDKGGKADGVIWVAVLANAGMGAVPLGINIWTFAGVNTLMVVFLGGIYEYHLSQEDAGKLIKQIFGAVGWTWMASVLGLKFFAEVLKGVGVITLGGTTVAGMALDALLSGAVTYALGYTTKDYFAKGKKMSKSELEKSFKSRFEEGKQKVKNRG
ncbi:DUF697 domain-containing protein [Oscillatoria sp. FACHB-1407]|uniref:YcjF family protein n=1 Tax=Oscillatoria sp. FACHB-1407 TaxID=2692847 RepID=UPI0016825308|nr:DUF697 domain-containing protein [Oscillatoria sp. FACHB-1407]MBD2462356.1 DUF697 domain-containing protein [Oscillatoria sp. FACHB-1407]